MDSSLEMRQKAILELRPEGAFSLYGTGEVTYSVEGLNEPSESEIQAKLVELQAACPLEELREKRNQLLAETDWMANKDVTLTTAWKTYRQELRDLPSGLDTVDKVNAVTWPEKPEE